MTAVLHPTEPDAGVDELDPRGVAVPVAMAWSAAAGLIHLLVAPAHLAEAWWLGTAFVVVGVAQVALAVLLRNLIDNALRYGPDGGRVQVQVLAATADAGARLVVEDAGPGLSDADLQRLGERFFRVLGSGQSGSGLGWSIVQRLARLHDLDMALDRSPALGGLRVTVRWPRG